MPGLCLLFWSVWVQSWILTLFSLLAVAALLWSMIALRPVSIFPMACISSSLSSKSQIFPFSSIRYLGMMTTPRWTFHRRTTWATVLPYF